MHHVREQDPAAHRQALDTPYITAREQAQCASSCRKFVLEVSDPSGALEPNGTSHKHAHMSKHTNTISGCPF